MLKTIILALSCVLGNEHGEVPHSDKSAADSGRVNFTLSETNNNSSVVLELWNEVVTQPNGETPQRLNGKLYLINQNIFSQNRLGKLDYYIDIGFHNVSDEKIVRTSTGNVYMTDRDWLTL